MRHRAFIKTLGLSLLTLIGVMAVSASAANAEWLMLKNGQSVLLLEQNLTFDLLELLVPGFGIAVHCESGAGQAHLEASNKHKDLLFQAEFLFEGCSDRNFAEVCDVHGVGDPNGMMTVQGTGEGSMEGERVLVDAEATGEAPFVNLVYEGEECPLTEIGGGLTGGVTLEMLNPLNYTSSKTIEVVDQNLFCGEEPLEIHDGSEPPNPATGSASPVGGGTFGVHLVNL